MKESTSSVDLTEEEILIYEASDETLEPAACGMIRQVPSHLHSAPAWIPAPLEQ